MLIFSAIALCLAAIITAVILSHRMGQIAAANPPIGDFITLPTGKIHYIKRGRGPDVILLHGAGGNLRDFDFALIDALAARYRVTAFDRPGLGYSDDIAGGLWDNQGASPAAQVAVLRAAARALGIRRPIVVGHSFGGIIALAWATQALASPNDQADPAAIVSFAGVAMPWPGGLGAYYTVNSSRLGGAMLVPLLAAYVPDRMVDAAVRATFAPQSAPDGYVAHLGGALALRPDSFRANARQVNQLRPHVVAMTAHYPALTLPIEIIHGDADTTVPLAIHAAELIKIAPSARLQVLAGIGHQPHHSAPAAAIAAIDRAAARAQLH